ncbi:DUF397 domain-containing protein [Yinghuangia sp. YIM S10712]
MEVAARTSAIVPVRDSKDTDRGHLTIPAPSWASLTTALKADR